MRDFGSKPIVENIWNVPYSLLCDESNEKGDSVKITYYTNRAFECEHSSISTRYLYTVGITGMTAVDIFEAIKVLVKVFQPCGFCF